jgi:[ribosomal protein S5]-alanine N-acetyltransferase
MPACVRVPSSIPKMWHTPRLTIRRFRPEDRPDLHALQGDPEATRFVGGPWAPAQTRETLERIVANYASTELEWLAVADRQTDRVLGVCWLNELASRWCDALGWGPEIQLGYRYAREHWDKGYATEAGRAMLRRGFDELGLESIVAIVDVRNEASERVLQKLGMRQVANGECGEISLRGYRIDRAVNPSSRITAARRVRS